MINIYLCDDSELLRQRYKNQITRIADDNSIEHTIFTFSSGEQLLSQKPNVADIIYLDVVMDGINGIETAKQLRAQDCQAEIIFLTSSEEYIFESFDVNPLYYMIKGSANEQKNFEKIFLQAAEFSVAKRNNVFTCENQTSKKQIPLHQISHFQLNGKTITVHFSTDNSFEFYDSMESLQEQLCEENFVLCHRLYMVNVKFIDEVGSRDVLLTTGERIPVGSAYAKELKLAFSKSLCTMF